jgi:threonine synthase
MTRKIYFKGFHCEACAASYPPEEDLLLCKACDGLLDADYDYGALKRDLDRDQLAHRVHDVWRWIELLPVFDERKIVTLGEGGSPLLRCEHIGKALGIRDLYVKSDATASPTGSLKDRSITICATKALEFGYKVLSCDSTGNKASSTAAYAARAGFQSVVFCPVETPLPKVAQAVFFGANVVRVKGHYSEINAMYRKLIHSGRVRWYDCGTDNPFRYEGKKTYAYEIAQSLGWTAPDWILQPAAGGMSIVKTWKGFNEMKQMGWVDRLPKMVAVQAAECAPIVSAWEKGMPQVSGIEKKPTIASAIAVSNPGPLGDWTLRSINASKGAAVGVTDSAIIEATQMLAREGLFVEPSGAVTIAALKQMVKSRQIIPEDRVVCVLTGSGFKDFERIMEMVTLPEKVIQGYEEMLALAETIK